MATKSKGERPGEKSIPLSLATRLEKSRKLAQKRRETYKDLMTGIMEGLPFPREILSQLDYNSRLRLTLCFFKMKSLLALPQQNGPTMIEASPDSKPVVYQPGAVQELMIEAMDGFLMVLLPDGSIVYLSESIYKHLGLFQSDHMGSTVYDLVLEEDHNDVKHALSRAEARAHARMGTKRGGVACSFFCRMKCSRNKVANTQSKSPGYKVVHANGQFRLQGSEPFLIALVKPVTPPNILELRMEGNMFVTHYSLDMKCVFFDGRLNHLMGYKKDDLEKKPVFDFHHHDDTEATVECSKGIQARGEGMSGYYRMLTKYGMFVWLQTRATMMFDNHTGQPSYIVCMNFIINKDKGYQQLAELQARKALEAPPELDSKTIFISEEGSKAHDPFPIPREDGKTINPLDDRADPSTAASEVQPSGVRVKVEQTSPPMQNHEEPSSTTNLFVAAVVIECDSPPQQNPMSGSHITHGNGLDSVPKFQSHSYAGEECLPDSTTAQTPDNLNSACHIDSGNSSSSFVSSSAQFGSSSKTILLSSPDSVLSGSGSSLDSSATLPQDAATNVQTPDNAGSIPIQPYTHSGFTASDSLQQRSSAPLSTPPSVYQEFPAVHNLRSEHRNTQPNMHPQQTNRLQELPRTSTLSHCPQDHVHGVPPTALYSHENSAASSQYHQQQVPRGTGVYPSQPPLCHHGGFRQPAMMQYDAGSNAAPQNFQPLAIKTEMPSQPSSCQFGGAPLTNFGSAQLTQQQQQQQQQQFRENGVFAPNFNFIQQQQSSPNQPQGAVGFVPGLNHSGCSQALPSVANQPSMNYVGVRNFSQSTGYPRTAFTSSNYPQGQSAFGTTNVNFHPNTQFSAGLDMPLQDSHFTAKTNLSSNPLPPPLFHSATHRPHANLRNVATSSAVPVNTATMATGSIAQRQTANPQMPGLVNLTGEDLQILEFIDELDSSSDRQKQLLGRIHSTQSGSLLLSSVNMPLALSLVPALYI